MAKRKIDLSVLNTLRKKADIFASKRNHTFFVLFSKSGFTEAVMAEARNDHNIILVELNELIND